MTELLSGKKVHRGWWLKIPLKMLGSLGCIRLSGIFDLNFSEIFSIVEIWLTVFFICRIIMVIYGKARHV